MSTKNHMSNRTGVKVKTVLKSLIFLTSLCIYLFFFFRICSSNDPRAMQRIVWNETTVAAYQQDPAAFEALEQFPSAYMTVDGSFWITNIVYLPEAKQLQVTVKYNDSTLRKLKEAIGSDYSIPEEPFVYYLVDDKGNRYDEHSFISAEKSIYNYRRLVFENIDLTDVSIMYIKMESVDSAGVDGVPRGSLAVWHELLETETRNVKKELPKNLK